MNTAIPKTFNEFARKYTPRIRNYILARNKENSVKIDPDEFVQEFLIKFNKKNTLEKYNPERGASFDTWLYRILYNSFCTSFRLKKEENEEVFNLPENYEKFISDHKKDSNTERYLKTRDAFICISEEDIELILNFTEDISDVRERLSIKLKAYPYIDLNDEDLDFMAQKTGIEKKYLPDELKKMYGTKPGERAGLKDKDIARLLGFSSFTNQRDRAVRKYIIPQYKYMKSRKQ